MSPRSFLYFLCFSVVSALGIPNLRRDGDIHLAVGPRCGPLSGNTSDVNASIDPNKIKTIVSFGVCALLVSFFSPLIFSFKKKDSYSSGGTSDGSPLEPAVLKPPYPLAGGRSTNGLLWIEHVANDINATVMDYAVIAPVSSSRIC